MIKEQLGIQCGGNRGLDREGGVLGREVIGAPEGQAV